MIEELDANEAIARMDHCYAASKARNKTSYPLFVCGRRTYADFAEHYKKCAATDNYKTLLFTDGAEQGVAQFFYLTEDKYLQLCGFYTDGRVDAMLAELLDYIEKRFTDYSLYFGFPENNTAAAAAP